MSVKLLSLVYEGFPKGGSEFDVLLALADSTNESTGRCDPSVGFLAWKTRQGERTVQYALKSLVAGEWIRLRAGQGEYGTNLYVLNKRKLDAAAAVRRQEYEEARDRRARRLPYPAWDDEFGVEVPAEGVHPLQVQNPHPRKRRAKGVQTAPEGVQTGALGGAAGCTQTGEPEDNQNKPLSEDDAGKPGLPLVPLVEEPETEPRWKPFLADLKLYWEKKNPGLPMTFNGQVDGKAVKLFLKDNPKIDQAIWRRCLNHRAKSDVPHGEQVHRWVRELVKYFEGPFDRFGKVKKADGGQKNEEFSNVNRGNRAGVEAWLARTTGGDGEALTGGEVSGGGGTVLEPAGERRALSGGVVSAGEAVQGEVHSDGLREVPERGDGVSGAGGGDSGDTGETE